MAALILVVDDSPIQCKIHAKSLKASGYEVITGENGRQGVDLALQHHPDLILMDLSMPIMDGFSAARELRAYPEMAELPILALTATADPDNIEQAMESGYSDIVDKTSTPKAILEKIQGWLR